MPKVCCVPLCKNPELMFYQLPADQKRRLEWLQAIRREDEKGGSWQPTSPYFYVCQKHFITEQINQNPTHPDYIPSIFPSRPPSASPVVKMTRFHNTMKRQHKGQEETRGRAGTEGGEDTGPEERELQARDEEGLLSGEETDQYDDPSGSEEDEGLHSVEMMDQATGFTDEGLHSVEMMDQASEIEALRRQVNALKLEREAGWPCNLKAESVKGDDIKCRELTGLSWRDFQSLSCYMMPFVEASTGKLSQEDQLFIVLLKLRQNPSMSLLSHVLNMGKTTMRDMFTRWINLLYNKMKFLIHWPDRECIHTTTPPAMKALFPQLTCIVDCFEIRIESPKNLKARAQFYSSYKKSTTVKYFIACSPAGSITFLSTGWGGRASDVKIVRECGFLSSNYHHQGDQILADRGFPMVDDFAVLGAHLLTPSFTQGRKQLPGKEVEESRVKSNVRIHIERVIGVLLKGRFRILDGPLSLRLVKTLKEEKDGQVTMVDKIVHVCAALVNMSESVVHSY